MGKNQAYFEEVKSCGELNENQWVLSSPKEGKGTRLWKKVEYRFVEYHALPGYLKDDEYILGHYRSEWPLRQFLLSVFTIRNETPNVWTHLIGFFLFISLTIYTAMKVPAVVDIPVLQNLPSVLRKADFQKLGTELTTCLPSLRHMCDWHIMERSMKEEVANIIAPLMVRPITRWPFFAFLGGAMFCLLASSTCHLLSCRSKRLSYIMLRLDYAVIAAHISTSFYPLSTTLLCVIHSSTC